MRKESCLNSSTSRNSIIDKSPLLTSSSILLSGTIDIPILFLHGTNIFYDSSWIKSICEVIDSKKFRVICPEFPSLFRDNSECNGKTVQLTAFVQKFILKESRGSQLILLGYPLTYKNGKIRNERLNKINDLKIPIHIFQGEMDKYGSWKTCSNLKFGSNIDLEWIKNTVHSFLCENESEINEETLRLIETRLSIILNEST